MTKKEKRVNNNLKAEVSDAAALCFDFLWMKIEKGNKAEVGIVTKGQLKKFSQKIHESGFLSGVNFERCK